MNALISGQTVFHYFSLFFSRWLQRLLIPPVSFCVCMIFICDKRDMSEFMHRGQIKNEIDGIWSGGKVPPTFNAIEKSREGTLSTAITEKRIKDKQTLNMRYYICFMTCNITAHNNSWKSNGTLLWSCHISSMLCHCMPVHIVITATVLIRLLMHNCIQ